MMYRRNVEKFKYTYVIISSWVTAKATNSKIAINFIFELEIYASRNSNMQYPYVYGTWAPINETSQVLGIIWRKLKIRKWKIDTTK